jgi:hypothetical protein
MGRKVSAPVSVSNCEILCRAYKKRPFYTPKELGMTWNCKYWDFIHKLYWSPGYIGLDPIGKIDITERDDLVCVPKEYLTSGRLRRRTKKEAEVMQNLGRSEDALNFFFDITFAIAPDRLFGKWFCDPLGITDKGPFRSFSLLEVTERYGWGQRNVTQHDSFFVSDNSVFFIELKLKADTSATQVLNYAALAVLEEKRSGKREHLGLLFLIPQQTKHRLWKQCGLTGPTLDRSFVNSPLLKANQFIRAIMSDDKEHFLDVLDRMKLAVITWSELYDWVSSEVEALDESNSDGQTLLRLLRGFQRQLQIHGDTGIGVQ